MSGGVVKIECGACGQMTPAEGAFCDQCRSPLEAAEGTPGEVCETADVSAPSPSAPVVSSIPATIEAELPAPVQPSPSVPSVPSATPVPVAVPVPDAHRVQSFCEDLCVEYNRSVVFVCGMTLSFDFRIRPLVDGLKDLAIAIEFTDSAGKFWRKHKKLHWHAMKGVAREIGLNFQPRVFGRAVFSIYVSYRSDGKERVFETEVKHRIYPEDSRAGDVLDKIIININNEITTGHAADVNVRQSLDELESLKKRADHKAPIRDFIDAITSEKAFCVLTLHPSRWSAPRKALAPSRLSGVPTGTPLPLTLRVRIADGRECLVHLYATTRLQLGRHRSCDLVTRIFNDEGVATPEANKGISRGHCRIELRGTSCSVVDGRGDVQKGSNRPSACGTYLNGSRVAAGTSVRLPLNQESTLSLGGASTTGSTVMGLRVLPWSCGSELRQQCGVSNQCVEERPSSLVIRRMDHIDESFVVLQQCCPLHMVDSSLAGIHVWLQDGVAAYGCNGSSGWLEEGRTIKVGMAEIDVMRQAQFGL